MYEGVEVSSAHTGVKIPEAKLRRTLYIGEIEWGGDNDPIGHTQDPTGWRYRKDYMQHRTSRLDAIMAAICYTQGICAVQFSCPKAESTPAQSYQEGQNLNHYTQLWKEEFQMMEEISEHRIEEYVKYFPGPQPGMVLASVVEGNTEAQLWYISQPGDHVVCLLWDKGNNVFYLTGQLVLPETINDLASLINTHIKEKAIKERLSHFKVKTLSSTLENSITDIFQDITLHRTDKLFYTFRTKRVKAIPNPGLEDIQFHPIDVNLLVEGQFENSQYVKSEIEWMWPSLERFRVKGFGTAAVIDGSIICWCTAEYVSKGKCGIGIEVVDEFQNKGIATATASHFLEQCLNQNIVAHWECDKDNIGSVRVAEKVGFEKIEETVFWGGQFLR